jgi:20S proteasome alpha/beta subunit
MTAIVGVFCRDGVVIGTDSSATFTHGPQRTIEQPTEKLSIVAQSVIVAGTGPVGLGQRFNRIAEIAYKKNLFAGSDHIEAGKALSRHAIEDFSHTFLKPGQYGALMGFHMGNQPRLCEFAVSDFQPEYKDEGIWYVSMGSGQPITDPFLALMRSIFWGDGLPTVQDGTFAVTWALEHAIEVNPGGINGPIRVAVLQRSKEGEDRFVARILDDGDLQEHKENIGAVKALLRKYAAAQNPSEDAPDVPKPETG